MEYEPRNAYQLLAKRQKNILQNLEDLKLEIMKMKKEIGLNHVSDDNVLTNNTTEENTLLMTNENMGKLLADIVIYANPVNPPLSIWVLRKLLRQLHIKMSLSIHVHSSITNAPGILKTLPSDSADNRLNQQANLTLIWKNVTSESEMIISPLLQSKILGEINILRYLSQSFIPSMKGIDPEICTEIDSWMDRCHFSLLHGNNKEKQSFLKQMNAHLGKCSFLVDNKLSIGDLLVWSVICQTKLQTSLPTNINKWFKQLSTLPEFSDLNLFNEF